MKFMKKISLFIFIAFVFSFTFSLSNAQTSPLCVSISNNLRFQSSDKATGGDVSRLQSFLKSAGYLTASPSGYFGGMTLTAVKNFQKAKGVDATGYVGLATRAKITTYCSGQQPITPSVTPTPASSVTPTPSVVASLPVLSISSISVESAPNDAMTPVILKGSNFTINTTLHFRGSLAEPIIPDTVEGNGTSLTFTVPKVIGVLLSGSYAVSASNDKGVTKSNEVYLVVTVPEISRYQITTGSLPDAKVGQYYTSGIQVTGFNTNYTWAIISGSLPPGIKLITNETNSFFGSLQMAGLPHTAGKYSFTVQATDTLGNTAKAAYILTVLPDPNENTPIPKLYGLSIYSGPVGTTVNAYGSKFDSKNYVLLNDRIIGPAISSGDGKNLSFTIPFETLPACNLFSTGGICSNAIVRLSPGVYTLTVSNIKGTTRSFDFTVPVPLPTQ